MKNLVRVLFLFLVPVAGSPQDDTLLGNTPGFPQNDTLVGVTPGFPKNNPIAGIGPGFPQNDTLVGVTPGFPKINPIVGRAPGFPQTDMIKGAAAGFSETDTVLRIAPGLSYADSLMDVIERSAEVRESDYDFSEVASEILERSRRPVNLNTTKPEELDAIPLLSPLQLKGLHDYRAVYGEILTIFELLSIPGFDSAFIRKLEPFIIIAPVSNTPRLTPGSLLKYGRHNVMVRLGQALPLSRAYAVDDSLARADPESGYPGNPQRYYFRYQYSWFDRIGIGISGEKDPGEQFFTGNQKQGFDYYAAHLSITNAGIIKNFVLGNFRINFGQGLTVGTGTSLNSIPGFALGQTSATGVRPSLSIDETTGLRGIGATIRIRKLDVSAFLSYTSRGGSIRRTDTITGAVPEIGSLSSNGNHRTPSEVKKKDLLKELLVGGHVSYSCSPGQSWGFRIGATGIGVRYTSRISPRTYPYNQFGFSGLENYNLGLDFQFRMKGIFIFGEVSRSMNGGIAWITGGTVRAGQNVTIYATARDYQPNYQNLFSRAFGQNTLNANEKGFYVAINAGITPELSLSTYVDLFRFPWLRYRADAPTFGQEFGLNLMYRISTKVSLGFRYSRKNLELNSPTVAEQATHKIMNQSVQSARFIMDWNPGQNVAFKTRIDLKRNVLPTSDGKPGILLYQDLVCKPKRLISSLSFRFGLFDIPGYENRIYVYEPEVLYGYSVPSYEGKGIRTCLVIRADPLKGLTFWVKGGITVYQDRQSTGSGPDQTEGNISSELTGQLQLRL